MFLNKQMINKLALLSYLYPTIKNTDDVKFSSSKNKTGLTTSNESAKCFEVRCKSCIYMEKSNNNLKLQNEYLKSQINLLKDKHKYCDITRN
jgi:hypothetical protein